MSASNAQMVNRISNKLYDSSNAIWTDAYIKEYAIEGLIELAKMHPFMYEAEFNLESRRGTANSDTANALVDSTEEQFLAGDVDKTVYNVDDRTYAKVTAFVSTSQLTLSADIFPDGDENYRIYNEGTTSSKEFSLKSPQQADSSLGSRVLDFMYIHRIEYPIRQDPPRYVKWDEQENDDIIRLLVDDQPDDTQQATAKDEVYVTFALRHWLTEMTTILGKVDLSAGYAAGSTSMVIDELLDGEVILKGQMFTIDGIRGIYVADFLRTVASSEATVTFWPPLLATATDDDVVRFVMSTLKEKHEGPFADLVAGKLMMDKAVDFVNTVQFGGGNPSGQVFRLGERKYKAAIAELEGQRGATFAMVDLP